MFSFNSSVCLLALAIVLCPGLSRADASASAINALLNDAYKYYGENQYEQAAAVLERALRIESRNSILWHNLAGIRLQQQDWARALSLAAKSNSLAVGDRVLRIRNWIVIALACDGMQDANCADEARKRAHLLAGQP
jgi:tetratricopeptide (TPR) repeat protein